MTEYWGKGITTQAVQKFCEEAFDKMDIIRITGSVFGENEASKRVLTKAGFMLEGVMRKAVYKNGKVMDLCLYGLYK
jgi:ribosomal-protein-alanine N-acetyltransferase